MRREVLAILVAAATLAGAAAPALAEGCGSYTPMVNASARPAADEQTAQVNQTQRTAQVQTQSDTATE